MKRNFKLVSLLTIFSVVLNILSVLVLMKPAFADTVTVTDALDNYNPGVSTTHTIGLDGLTGLSDNIIVTLESGFTGIGSATVSNGTCIVASLIITCTTTGSWVDPITDLVVTGFINPATPGAYTVGMSSASDSGTVEVTIASDTVIVNGYINSSLSFDIDTTTASSPQECTPTTCLAYEGYTDNALTAYTVDLGNLTTGAINKSEDVSVLHADGGYGLINSIYFDLSTNAVDGAIVTVISTNKALDSADDTIAATTTLSVGSEGYGINVSSAGSTTADCSDATYCDLSGSAVSLFHTIAPVEGARVIAAVAAAVSPLTNPGTYTDTLTFVATATF